MFRHRHQSNSKQFLLRTLQQPIERRLPQGLQRGASLSSSSWFYAVPFVVLFAEQVFASTANSGTSLIFTPNSYHRSTLDDRP